MAASRATFRRRIGQLVLLAFLIVPLRLSAHVHPDRPTPSSTCSICSIASHWIVEEATHGAGVEPVLLGARVVGPAPKPVFAGTALVRRGRAPPSSIATPL